MLQKPVLKKIGKSKGNGKLSRQIPPTQINQDQINNETDL